MNKKHCQVRDIRKKQDIAKLTFFVEFRRCCVGYYGKRGQLMSYCVKWYFKMLGFIGISFLLHVHSDHNKWWFPYEMLNTHTNHFLFDMVFILQMKQCIHRKEQWLPFISWKNKYRNKFWLSNHWSSHQHIFSTNSLIIYLCSSKHVAGHFFMCKSSCNLFCINFVGFQLLFPLLDENLGIKYEKSL